ncbi:MAG TPA: ribonuclease R [Steroidobacteraceae bacterium]|nr:ribonuclease R [Steroidobacteraceae bacterium]
MSKNDDWRHADARQTAEGERYEHPIPSRDFLLEVLEKAGTPLTAAGFSSALRLRDKGLRAALDKRLAAMVRDGQLLRNRRDEYLLPGRIAVVSGQVMGHRDGFGFLVPDDGSDDLFLPPGQMRGVMHGDRVAVRVVGVDARNRKEAAVVEVLERRTRQVAGRFHLERGVGFVVPDNRRISQRVVIPSRDRGGAADGALVVAELMQPPNEHAEAIGRVTRVLPEEGVAQTAVELAIASHQLPHEFPVAAVREARRYGKALDAASLGERLDLRGIPLVTIDGEDARDFDDAVYAEPTRTGWRLIVAIADVSHYVRPGTALDTEARLRATSVYFPNRVIPMLPEELSNQLCSLMPDVDRACMVAELAVGRDGKVTRPRFYAAVMRSAARLTYTRAAAALIERLPEARHGLSAGVLTSLESLYDVYRALRRWREARGALDFESAEVKVVVGEDGKVAELRSYPRNDAHRLIEECMIAANVEAAGFLKKHKMPALYRVHAQPDEERILELKRFLATRGLLLETDGDMDPMKLARLLKQVQGRPDAAMLEGMIIRSLAQAVYQPENIGHFGLALGEYAHFTSPIRRYPDLLVHRAIRHVLAGGTADGFEHPAREMETLGQECSMRERRADEASRDVVTFLRCVYMLERVGESFDGVVTGVTAFGLFVQLDGMQVDGLVHVASLGRDYYRFEEDRRALVGERSGQRFTLGDRLRVRVTRVDPSERKIDFELVEQVGEAFHPRRKPGKPGKTGKAKQDERSGATARPKRSARGRRGKPR